jgi:hypothetical protein
LVELQVALKLSDTGGGLYRTRVLVDATGVNSAAVGPVTINVDNLPTLLSAARLAVRRGAWRRCGASSRRASLVTGVPH